MNDKSQVEYILDDIRTMVDNVIIKLTNKADEYETASIKREADRYVAAYMERDSFNSYRDYPIDVLVNAGITNINLIMEYKEDKTKIPKEKRKEVLRCMRKQIIDEYIEQNDYYRELIGLPSLNTPEEEYLYLTEEEMMYYGIDEVRPIHDYPQEIQLKLERSIIPSLIKQYPEKTYLQHMGSKAVELVRAREAKNFEIIFTDVQLDSVFMRAFFNTYDFCREYFMSMIYNKQFKARYDLYDNYIGMHIMIMTVQRLIVDTIKMCIDRDFYDLISIKKLFNVYGLPFYEDLPLDYQRMICKNVNWLIRCKSTDKVLYDVANTLFYDRLEIHKFYLVKDRKFDENGEPVYKYKFIAIDDKYDVDSPDYYFRCQTTGKIYKLMIHEEQLYYSETNNVLNDYVNDILCVRDGYDIYEIFIKNGMLEKNISDKSVSGLDELYIYDNRNNGYSLSVQNGEFIIEKIVIDLDDVDYSNIIFSLEKKFLLSDNGNVYEIYIDDDRLASRLIDKKNVEASSSIRILNDRTGEKMVLYMHNERICGDLVDDNLSADVLYLYNKDSVRFILLPEGGKLCSYECGYKLKKVLDYENMFDVYFQSTEILETNVVGAIEQKKFRYDYHEVTDEDEYWWETDELKKELYEREYNYIDTKYIGVNLMQNLTKLLYESSYYLNMLIDHKDITVPINFRILNSDAMKMGTDYLNILLDRISSTPISIFDTVMILCALISKKNGMKGNIIVNSPAQILSVLGFNFELNFDLIRNNIRKYKYIFKNQEILKYLDLLDIQKVTDIDVLFNNFRNFAEFCEEIIANTNDINEYKTYKELYKVITVRKDSTKLFTKNNGELATTYLDYLYDRLPVIAKFVDELHKEKTGVYIDHVLGKLNELVPEIEYLYSMNGTNNNIINAIIGLINFFKSYTVDLRNLNVMFMFDNKRMNKVYMIDDPRLFSTLFPEEEIIEYSDDVKYKSKFDKFDNLIICKYKSQPYVTLYNNQQSNSYDDIKHITKNINYIDAIEREYKDIIISYNNLGHKDHIEMKLINELIVNTLRKDVYNISEILKSYNDMNIDDNIELFYKDIIDRLVIVNNKYINIPIKENVEYLYSIYKKNRFNSSDKTYNLMNLYNLFSKSVNYDTICSINKFKTNDINNIDDIISYNNRLIIGNETNYLNIYDSIKIIYED